MLRRFSVCLIILLVLSSAAHCTDWTTRPGTIKHALTLQDGSTVSLDAEIVDKIVASGSPAYFVIRECFDSKSRIVVMTQPSSELRLGQTVDVQGVISTLSDGQRVIVSPTVYGYTDRDGNLLYHGPLIKGPMGPIAWEWKVNLTVSARQMTTMDEEPTPPGEPNTSPPVGATQYSTIADAKLQADGTPVELLCKPITSTGTNCFFIDEDASGNPLKVYCAKAVTTSQRVCRVTGTMQTEGSDRVLTVDASGPGYDPQVFVGTLTVANAGTIAWVKTWSDNHTFVTGDLTGKIVTRKWDNCLYIEEADRSSGIRIDKTAHGRNAGERVDVVGVLKTDPANYERYIDASSVSQNGTGSVAPLGMINRSLGGGDWYYDPNTGQGQRGITGGSGVSNIGLLVRTWGKVTDTGPTWFRVNDGSNVQTTVAYPPFTYTVNDFITIAGISSCEVDAHGDLQRVLRLQPLTCTICKAEGQADPTNAGPVNFTVAFSEPVVGFSEADVTVSDVPGATKVVTGNGASYNVAITLPASGAVTVSIPSGIAQNASGILNYASTDAAIVYDSEVPVITDCTVTPTLSTGQVTVTYTGASDTGGSGLLAVGLYQVVDGQYEIVDARTGSSNSFTLSYTGNGTVENLALIAFDNAGNQSLAKPVPPFTIDHTAPSTPAGVAMAHVLPTSRYIHATWDASTDANGIQNYSYQFWYTTSSGGPYALTSVLTTTNTWATYDLGGYLAVDPTVQIGVRVWARDNAGNVSNYTDSTGVACNKVKVGFLYYKCETGLAYTYSDVRWHIDSYLNRAKSFGPCVGNVTYTTLSSAPSTTGDYASYDVLFVALPASDFTSTEIGAIQSFVNNQGFNKRLVLVGEYGKTSLGNGYSTDNARLNTLMSTQNLNLTTRFHADEGTQNSYPYEQGISYRDCPVRSHYLTNGVGGLWDAGPSTFASYVHPIAALRDGENAYPGQFWVVEEDISQGCSIVCIHDCGMFLFEYDNNLQAYPNKNLVGNYETNYDDVPDRNFRFVENLYTIFPH